MKLVLGIAVGVVLVVASITVIGIAAFHSMLLAAVSVAETERANDGFVPD